MTESNFNADTGLTNLPASMPIVPDSPTPADGLYQRLFALNQMPIVIVSLNDGWVIESNKSFSQQFDLEPSRDQRVKFGERFNCEEERSGFETAIAELSHRISESFTLSCRLRTSNSGTVDVLINADRLDEERAVLMIQDVTERLERENRATELANFDALTSLPNRRLFSTELERQVNEAAQQNNRLGVMFLDLDGFKEINDTLGHEAGDELLVQVANRLRQTLRKGDYIARLGGDEFAVINSNSSRFNTAETAQRLIDSIAKPISVGGFPVNCSVSIGISSFPDDGNQGTQLLKHADIAMYEAKRNRKGFSVFGPEEGERIRSRVEIRKELERAIHCKSDELTVYFQPRINLEDNSIRTVEALARWNHPTRGSISPEVFFSIAEETALIHQLGQLLLERVCKQIKQWESKGFQLCVAINLSAKELERSDIIKQMEAALEEHRVCGRQLEVEIPETASMKDITRSVRFMSRLKTLGVNVAIDDFGTGYSSLTYLKQLPADSIKIDQSFLMPLIDEVDFNSPDADIVRAIVTLANSFHMTTIAEGVETQLQYEFLKSLGCDFAQGFYFNAPMPASELENLIMMRRIAGNRPQV